jgi:transcriptional regulator with XRE-family HTH domain
MTFDKAAIGARLREARGTRSLEHIFEETGVPRATLHKIETGAVETRLSVVVALCKFYGLSLDELCGLKPPSRRQGSVASIQRLLERALAETKKIRV